MVFKKTSGKVLWLITKTTISKEYPKPWWRLPKGWLDDVDDGKKPGPLTTGEIKTTENDLISTATREVKEESGVEANVIKKIDIEKFFYKSKEGTFVFKMVYFYLMQWISDESEGYGSETSEIAWLGYEEARKKLKQSGEKKILDKAKELLDSGIQISLI